MPKPLSRDKSDQSETSRAFEREAAPKRSRALRAAVLFGVVATALVIREAAALTQPNLIWPDEVFQTIEPAHRLIYGSGLMSWEWIVGIRSWLVPAMFAPLFLVARALQLGPGGPLLRSAPR